MNKIKHFYYICTSSFWFLPLIVVLIFAALASVVIVLDSIDWSWSTNIAPLSSKIDKSGARAILSTVAAAMITVESIVFSITIVALTQAAIQYTSRILRNFMRRKMPQFALGYFSGVFIFCLIIVPNLNKNQNFFSLVSGFIFACISVIVLFFFLHDVVSSLLTVETIEDIKKEIKEGIENTFPKELAVSEVFFPSLDEPYIAVPSSSSGYVEFIELQGLYNFAKDYDTSIELKVHTGEFVYKGQKLALVKMETFSPELIRSINSFIRLGKLRTPLQDPSYGIQQLVDILLKALSPSVNDQTTGIIVLDHLREIFIEIGIRKLYMELPDFRVMTRNLSYAEIFWRAFYSIFEAFKNNQLLLRKLKIALADIKKNLILEERVEVVQKLETMVEEAIHPDSYYLA